MSAGSIASGPPGIVTGDHWLLDLSGCTQSHLLESAHALQQACLAAARAAGMDIVGHVFHQFKPMGVTGVVLLAESHLSVHSWPESRFVAADVYVCDHTSANRERGRRAVDELIVRLGAASVRERHVSRGSDAAARPGSNDAL